MEQFLYWLYEPEGHEPPDDEGFCPIEVYFDSPIIETYKIDFKKYYSLCQNAEENKLNADEEVIKRLDPLLNKLFDDISKKKDKAIETAYLNPRDKKILYDLSKKGAKEENLAYLKKVCENWMIEVKQKIYKNHAKKDDKTEMIARPINISGYITRQYYPDLENKFYDFLLKLDKKYLAKIYRDSLKYFLLKNNVNRKTISKIVSKIKLGLLEIPEKYGVEANLSNKGVNVQFVSSDSRVNDLLLDYKSYLSLNEVLLIVDYLDFVGMGPILWENSGGEEGPETTRKIKRLLNDPNCFDKPEISQSQPTIKFFININEKPSLEFCFFYGIHKILSDKIDNLLDKRTSKELSTLKKRLEKRQAGADKQLNKFFKTESLRPQVVKINMPAPIFFLIRTYPKYFKELFK
jgi:hypothetical protein